MFSKKNNRFFFAFLVILFGVFNASFAQDSVAIANRQTALRCLQLSKDYINKNDLNSALPQIELGLVYDNSISDLWYLKAVIKSSEGALRSEVLPLVQQALSLQDWVDYNQNGARILYADILSDTGFYEKAVVVLDEQPFLYSADAEYIRVKSYYRMNSEEGLRKARDKIDGARRIYPEDSRFARLFLKHEYVLLENSEMNSQVRRIADSFISSVPRYSDSDAELQLYAALFATGENQERMLKSFQAKELRHPFFAIAALKAGFMTQKEALDYFISFADTSISIEYLQEISLLITEDEPKQFLVEYLNSYSGVLTADTDNDLENNLSVNYLRGRPQYIKWDKNNDGIYEWTAECDFGVPLTVSIPSEKLVLGYGSYPYLNSLSLQNSIGRTLNMTLVDEQFLWSPFNIEVSTIFQQNLGVDFFIVQVENEIPSLDSLALENAAISYDIDSDEYANAKIHFSILNGVPQTADYLRNGKQYAHAFFVDGIPATRAIDKDGDGIFETVETFALDSDHKMNISEQENNQLMTNIYGFATKNQKNLYIKMIQVDQDGDTQADFIEEYLADNGKITSWDSNSDGQWDIRYVRYPQKNNESLLEDSMFYLNPGNVLTTVSCSDGEPIKVSSGTIEYSVTRGNSKNFYWVGTVGLPEDEQLVLESLYLVQEQGKSILVSNEDRRILSVKMGSNYFGRIIEEPLEDEVLNENENMTILETNDKNGN